MPTHCSREHSVVHCLAIPKGNGLLHTCNCLTLKMGVLPETSVSTRMTELKLTFDHSEIPRIFREV